MGNKVERKKESEKSALRIPLDFQLHALQDSPRVE